LHVKSLYFPFLSVTASITTEKQCRPQISNEKDDADYMQTTRT